MLKATAARNLDMHLCGSCGSSKSWTTASEAGMGTAPGTGTGTGTEAPHRVHVVRAFGMEIANHYCGFGKKASLAKEQQTWVGSRKKYTSMHENFGLKARAQSGNSKLDCTGPWRRAQGKNAYTLMAFPGKPSPGKTARSWLVQQDKPISILIQMLQTSVNQSPCQMPSQCRWQWRWQKARMLKSLAHSRSRRFVARTRRLLLRLDI